MSAATAGFLAVRHARVLPALGLSLALHGALLAGWRPALMTPPQLAAFEPIEIALLTDSAPNLAAARRPAPAAQPAPAAADEPATMAPPATATGPAGHDEPIVEARSDVASLNNPRPPYPLAARRRGLQGRVLLSAHVGANGACTAVKLKLSSGHGLLDDAALDTVRRWRFIPAQRGARAIDSWVDVPVSFRLES